MAMPTPTAMPARRAPYPAAQISTDEPGLAGAEEILFTDTATGLVGVVRQRRGDGLFLFHPTADGVAAQLVEEPGRFRALRHAPGHTGHDREQGDQAGQDGGRSEARAERRRPRPHGHRGGGRGRRQGQ